MEALITETKYADVHTQKMNSVFAGLQDINHNNFLLL